MSTVGTNPVPVICHLSPYQASTLNLLLATQCLCLFLNFFHKWVYTLSRKCAYGWSAGGEDPAMDPSPRPHSYSFACTKLFWSIQLGWKSFVISLNSSFAVVYWFSLFLPGNCFRICSPLLSSTKMAGLSLLSTFLYLFLHLIKSMCFQKLCSSSCGYIHISVKG